MFVAVANPDGGSRTDPMKPDVVVLNVLHRDAPLPEISTLADVKLFLEAFQTFQSQ